MGLVNQWLTNIQFFKFWEPKQRKALIASSNVNVQLLMAI
jgi:hypothetical protein